MSTLSRFLARGARRDDARAQFRDRKNLRGPVVTILGWRKGLDKGALTLMLRENGLSLTEAFDTTNRILNGERVEVILGEDVDCRQILQKLAEIGAEAVESVPAGFETKMSDQPT